MRLRKLIDAALKGQSEIVLSLLSNVSEDRKRSNLTNQALRWAAGAGHANLVQMLLSQGASPDRKDGYGTSSLMYAAMRGHIEVAQILLSMSASPDVRTPQGVTALMLACGNSHPEIVRLLLEHQADPFSQSPVTGETALMLAAGSCCLEAVVLLTDQIVTLEVKTIGGPASGYVEGITPLMYAAARGCSVIVEYLLSQGADPNVSDVDKHDALWWAARNGHSKICTLLGEHTAKYQLH
jgi:ankyrin repeat protein